jgi:fructose-bisphosphate aldolase class II
MESTQMTIDYSSIGLVNTEEMFRHALKGKYAIPGYNFNNMEQLQAIIVACVETKAPVILQVSKGARAYANQTLLRHMAEGAVKMASELGYDIPIALHLDHGDSYEICKSCMDTGFSSVMIDGSHLNFEENIQLTKKVVDTAHPRDIAVEAELGVLAGIEEDVSAEKSHYTKPEEVEEFVGRTNVDSLAISIGTSHGAYKFPPGVKPELRFDILYEIEERLPEFPIVLHGASSVLPEYVDIINKYGGNLSGARGVPEGQLRKAAKSAVCKINIDSDGRLAVTAMVRKYIKENPEVFDPRKYLGVARDELTKMIKHKNINVLGNAGKA